MKRAKHTIAMIGIGFALASCRGPVYAPTATIETVSVRILASTSTQGLLQDLAAAYSQPGRRLIVDSDETGWSTLFGRVQTGDYPFALVRHLPVDVTLWAAPIGFDGLVIIVHPDNEVGPLDVAQLRAIFRGYIGSWHELGGQQAAITVISREPGADLRLVFDALVMGQSQVTPAARLTLTDEQVIEAVAADPTGIGYISMATDSPLVRRVPLLDAPDGTPVLATPATVTNGTYPLRAPLLIVGAQPPEPDSFYHQWFAWMQSPAGQLIIGQQYGTLAP